MKQINKYIVERLHINKDTGNHDHHYNYHPKTYNELKELVYRLINERGNDADLNDIDTSEITDMSRLFYESTFNFNGNISNWVVSNVEDMNHMFYSSEFNGDISNWDVSNVENMEYMFAYSKFNGDISNWDVSNVENMRFMFYASKFTAENGYISNWDVSNVKDMRYMFNGTHLFKNPPKWYK